MATFGFGRPLGGYFKAFNPYGNTPPLTPTYRPQRAINKRRVKSYPITNKTGFHNPARRTPQIPI